MVAVTALEWVRGGGAGGAGASHLLSGSADGAIAVWRASDWLCLDVLHGHRAAVVSVSAHPSGRLALSLSSDARMVMWDLTKCRVVHAATLPGRPQSLRWICGGAAFLVAYDACLALYSGTTGELIRRCGDSEDLGSKGTAVYGSPRMCDNVVVTADALGASAASTNGDTSFAFCGHEGGDVSVWELPSGRSIRRFATGHAKRVRCVAFCAEAPLPEPRADGDGGGGAARALGASADLNPLSPLSAATSQRVLLPAGSGPFLVTSDSEGAIFLWNARALVSQGGAEPPARVAALAAAAGTRITCLAACTAYEGGICSDGGSGEAQKAAAKVQAPSSAAHNSRGAAGKGSKRARPAEAAATHASAPPPAAASARKSKSVRFG